MRFRTWLFVLLLTGGWFAGSSLPAQQATGSSEEPSSRKVTSEEVREIAKLLISPCCWSETADRHQSQAARQVRAQIREMLMQGYSRQQILEAFEQAYGERILARPHARGFNLLVWVLPGVVLLISIVGTWKFLIRIQTPPPKPSSQKARAKKASSRDQAYLERIERELDQLEG